MIALIIPEKNSIEFQNYICGAFHNNAKIYCWPEIDENGLPRSDKQIYFWIENFVNTNSKTDCVILSTSEIIFSFLRVSIAEKLMSKNEFVAIYFEDWSISGEDDFCVYPKVVEFDQYGITSNFPYNMFNVVAKLAGRILKASIKRGHATSVPTYATTHEAES